MHFMNDKKKWTPRQHEYNVENFYATGIDGFHDYHAGYLNFGFWTDKGMTYEQAAENLVKQVAMRADLNEKDSLLDVGCGMGTQDIFFHNRFGPRSIDALDVTWKHIERGRERARQANVSIDRLRFHHGSAVHLPFPDQSFTKLISIEAPEHFDTREVFFKEAFRVLKPGGVMVICDYSLVRPLKNQLEKWVVTFARRLWQVPAANVYGNGEFKRLLKQAGFNQVEIENVGQWTIPGYFFEHRRWTSMKQVAKVRGWLKGVLGGFLIDVGVFGAFKLGLLEYVIVRAVKNA